MSEFGYTISGVAGGLGLLVIYAVMLWWGHRAVSRRRWGAKGRASAAEIQ